MSACVEPAPLREAFARPSDGAARGFAAPAVSAADETSFVRARPRLLGIARRVLRSAADADDVVQEAWIRWQSSDRSVVRDPGAFLATTTARLALNVGQSARARHETDFAPRLTELVDPAADPTVGADRRAAIELALWSLLETLTPTERAVYLLREAFDYPHRRTAEVLGLSEANARQLVTRARRHLADDPRWLVDRTEHARLVDAFLAAAQTGDLARLESALTEETTRVALAA